MLLEDQPNMLDLKQVRMVSSSRVPTVRFRSQAISNGFGDDRRASGGSVSSPAWCLIVGGQMAHLPSSGQARPMAGRQVRLSLPKGSPNLSMGMSNDRASPTVSLPDSSRACAVMRLRRKGQPPSVRIPVGPRKPVPTPASSFTPSHRALTVAEYNIYI